MRARSGAVDWLERPRLRWAIPLPPFARQGDPEAASAVCWVVGVKARGKRGCVAHEAESLRERIMSKVRVRRVTPCLAVLFVAIAAVVAAEEAVPTPSPARDGAICLAAFHSDPSHGPVMDLAGPGPQSVYSFKIAGGEPVRLAEGERRLVANLPTDRKILIAIALDGRPSEAFRVDLGREPQHRYCLWLYPGYWHWIDGVLDPKLGCTCWEPGE